MRPIATSSGSLAVSAGKQLLVKKASPWSRALLDSDGGHCSGGVHHRTLHSASKQNIDRVCSSKARQDGKLLDKTQNTKCAAQQVADLIHSWVPTRSADPDTQQELTQLRSQLAQLRQQLGEEPNNSDPTGPSASSPPANPIHAALMRSSGNPAPPAPPAFDPSSLLVGTTTPNPWLAQHLPSSLAARTFQKWLKKLPISEPKRKVLNDNIAKTETWWNNQPAEAIETVTRVAVIMGIPVSLMGKNMDALNLLKTMTAAITMTN